MKTLLFSIILCLSLTTNAADFTIQLQPADNSVSNSQVSSITSSKISDFVSSVLSSISSTLNNYLLKSDIKATTITKLSIVGPGTYTTPPGVLYLKIKMIGGGGGGSGTGIPSAGAGGNGGTTSFGDSLLTAFGGNGGTYRGSSSGGSGTINLPAKGLAISGGAGGMWSDPAGTQPLGGGIGASSAFGGAGRGGAYNDHGQPAMQNSGSGGGGAGNNNFSGVSNGTGGGAGAYIEAIIENPSASYPYQIGSSGSNGAAGPNGLIGGAGGTGVILIEEFYQ